MPHAGWKHNHLSLHACAPLAEVPWQSEKKEMDEDEDLSLVEEFEGNAVVKVQFV